MNENLICRTSWKLTMPTMLLSWPDQAILDLQDFVHRSILAVDAYPGGKMETWLERRWVGDRLMSTWKAKITTQTDEHLAMIKDAITAMGLPALPGS